MSIHANSRAKLKGLQLKIFGLLGGDAPWHCLLYFLE